MIRMKLRARGLCEILWKPVRIKYIACAMRFFIHWNSVRTNGAYSAVVFAGCTSHRSPIVHRCCSGCYKHSYTRSNTFSYSEWQSRRDLWGFCTFVYCSMFVLCVCRCPRRSLSHSFCSSRQTKAREEWRRSSFDGDLIWSQFPDTCARTTHFLFISTYRKTDKRNSIALEGASGCHSGFNVFTFNDMLSYCKAERRR